MSAKLIWFQMFFITVSFFSCTDNYTPKPKGYYRIDFPEKRYRVYQSGCSFTAEIPVYAIVTPDEFAKNEPCWMNIVIKSLNAKIHLSYKNIHQNLSVLLDDAHTLAYKHSIKADAINEKVFINHEKKVYGILYEIKGDAASSVQFFMTDSTDHYIRGALYFNTNPNKDSLAPVVQFLKTDIVHFIETLNWK